MGRVKEPVVDPRIEPVENSDDYDAIAPTRFRASDWLWHPWYAKLWWAAILIYWAGKIASFYTSVLEEFYTSALAGFLNILFHPLAALMVLGVGFARAWFAWSDWEFVEPTHEEMFPRQSMGGLRDPYSDPLDPRSGMLHWKHFHRGK